ncbi:CDP-2,3-bis-(O-geranylgeranyl)-sn-glycerol synthase [Candidatus Bathyarchaeota archaeon]|nr:CDP-2,3-bis-(O-geranylgeranyl)-sn-glycerol synthase [Candidatus Bathyarchaeota archaeon]
MNLQTILSTIYLFLPSYFANASPVVFGGGAPLDGGRTWLDGKPFLGSHKTVKGTFFGVAVGLIVGLLQGNLLGGALQSVGAITGDIVASFFKRRWNLHPGESMPLVDQLDFITFAIVMSYPVQRTSLESILIILVLTVPLHYIVNYVAWALRLKDHPW